MKVLLVEEVEYLNKAREELSEKTFQSLAHSKASHYPLSQLVFHSLAPASHLLSLLGRGAELVDSKGTHHTLRCPDQHD